jgi:hypothetical protein
MKPSAKVIEMSNAVLLGAVKEALREGHSCTLNVRGFSMRPFLEDRRDAVILSPVGSELHEGDAVLAELTPGHYVLHRIFAINDDKVTLMGDGNIRGTELCRKQDICGIVTRYIHPRFSFNANSRMMRCAVPLWRHLLPVRRYLLLIYRIAHKIKLI